MYLIGMHRNKFLAETEYTETVGRIPNLAFTVFHLRTIYLLNKLVKHIYFFLSKKKMLGVLFSAFLLLRPKPNIMFWGIFGRTFSLAEYSVHP